MMKIGVSLAKRVMGISESETLAIGARAKELRAQGKDVVNLASGEPDFDTPDHIKSAAKKAIDEGFTKYTPASGIPELKHAICDRFKKQHQLDYKPEEIIISSGAKHSIYNVVMSLCERDDEVIIPVPYWVTYPELVRLANATPVFLQTSESSNFRIKVEDLKKVITRKTKVIFLNSPSNPTGCVYTEDELKEIARVAFTNGIYIISDEVYDQMVYDGFQAKSIASISVDGRSGKDYTIIVNAVSKTYSMTGWRIGYVAAPSFLVKAMNKLQSHATSNPCSISQKAALEALSSPQTCVTKMVSAFEKRRNYVLERLAKIPGVRTVKPTGAFYVFPNIGGFGMGSAELASRLLNEVYVAVVPGAPFGRDEHIRISYSASMENLEKGLDAMEKFFSKL